MHLHSPRRSSFALCALTFILLVGRATAQPTKVLAPHKPVAPRVAGPPSYGTPVLRSITGALWMMDQNFRSTIYLKNNVETSAITVTPILYLSNGAKYALADVTLEPAGTATISVNQELAKKNIASWATLKGYVEIEYRWPWDALCGMVQNVDTAHSLIFTDFLGPRPDSVGAASGKDEKEVHTLEGMWWKQESNVTGFVTLSNLTGEAARVKVQVSDNDSKIIGNHTVTVSPHGTKFVDLQELQLANSAGGIAITYDGPADRVVVNGGLEDPQTGYSASLRFARPLAPSAVARKMSYAALGLMVGAADPMMSFPPDTVFTPYTVLRNIEDQPISVVPTLYWMEAASARSATLQPLTLAAHRSENVDVMSLLSAAGLKNYNGMVNLILETEHKSQGLLVEAGSVDQKNTYVFEVTARPVAESASKGMSYWNTGDGNDTMVTLWNPADEAQDLLFTLYFSGGHYGFPVHLGPRATHTFNVSEVVHNQIPDAEGNIIPASAHEGSAVLSGMHDENEMILVAMDAGTYNVRKATCGGQCITCNGQTSDAIVDNPFGVGVGGTHQLSFTMTWNTGQHFDYGSESTWTSNHTNLATVDNGTTAGKVTGVSPGAVTIIAIADQVPQYAVVCSPQNFPPPQCPVQDFSGSGGGTVFKFAVTGNNYIFVGTDPQLLLANSFQASDGSGNLPQPPGGTCCAASSDITDAVTTTQAHGSFPPEFQFTSLDQSTTNGDRTLTFEYDLPSGEGTSQQKQVTAREFAYVTNDSPSDACTLGHGNDRTYTYTVFTHPDRTAVIVDDDLNGTAVTEGFSLPPCGAIGNANINSNAKFVDHIRDCSSTPLTCVKTTTQTLKVAGYQVRQNTLKYSTSGFTYTSLGPTQ